MAISWLLPLEALGFGLISALSLPLGALLGLCCGRVSERVIGYMMAFGSGSIVFAVATQLYGEALTDYEDSYLEGCQDRRSAACASAMQQRFLVMIVQILAGVSGAVVYYILNKQLQGMAGGKEELENASRVSRLQGSALGSWCSVHSRAMLAARAMSPRAAALSPKAEPPTALTAPQLPLLPAPKLAESGEAPLASQATTSMGMTCHSQLDSHTGADLEEPCLPSMQGEISDKPPSMIWQEQQDHGTSVHSDEPEFAVPEGAQRKDGARVALAMWLGVALDGIPEALMLGLMTNQHQASWYFLAAIFIANFPESFSAAILLREHGVKKYKIVGMWSSIFVMTGLLAFLGSLLMPQFECKSDAKLDFTAASMEGLTSGAMFAMIATAMIPEAFHGAGDTSGFMFVLGFLTACMLQVIGIHMRGVDLDPCL